MQATSRYELIRLSTTEHDARHTVRIINKHKMFAVLDFGQPFCYVETTIEFGGVRTIETWYCKDKSKGIFTLIDRVRDGSAYREDFVYHRDKQFPLYCKVNANA